MAKMPDADLAYVPPPKINDYLLADTHNEGASKSRFLAAFGFRRDAPDALEAALLSHARLNDVSRLQTTAHGAKYVIEGPMATPDGRAPVVWTIWIVDAGEHAPRFVTAYPAPRRTP